MTNKLRWLILLQMERVGLNNLASKEKEFLESDVRQMARDYAELIGLNYDLDVAPFTGDEKFWNVDYIKGKDWGLSTMDAYRCLVDTHRTVQIMGGIRETVNTLKKNGARNIRAIDAGTGTGIFAIYLASLGVDKVYALELNEETAEVAEKFIHAQGFSKKIELIVGDATKIEIPELREKHADILVSENLSAGLLSEPQFQIIGNLSRFMSDASAIIPYSADLSLSLGNGNWNEVDWYGREPTAVVAAKRLPSSAESTSKQRYASVQSVKGMNVPRMLAGMKFVTDTETPINTLFVTTAFQINSLGDVYKLESDSANYLGKTIAIKLPHEAYPEDKQVDVELEYDAGFSIKRNPDSLKVDRNKITFKGILK